MRKYHKKAERQFDDYQNVDIVRLKKGLELQEVDVDELAKFAEIEYFLHHRFLDEQKAFIREFGHRGFKLTFAVYEIIENRHLECGKVGRRE